MGSSGGIAQLEVARNQTTTGIGTTQTTGQQRVTVIDYARSSRNTSPANDVRD